MRYATIPALGLLLGAGLTALAAPAGQTAVTGSEIKHHVGYLASEQLEGRGTATPGERKAGDYIAKQFAAYGLVGAGTEGTFFQSFEVAGTAKLRGTPSLTLTGGAWSRELKVSSEWNPFGFSGSFDREVELVFAGYGVTDKQSGYDDYAGIDVKGKAVLILRHEPGASKGKRTRNSFFTTKLTNAKRHGAVAALIVNGPLKDPGDDSLMPFGSVGGRSIGLLAGHVKQSLIQGLFKLMGQDLLAIQTQIDAKNKPHSFTLGKLSAKLTIDRKGLKARNVLGMLRGTDPTLRNEVVVVGAHYDHLGMGGHGGSLGGGKARGQIHNGADDNASGTAGMLELAQALAANPPKRSVLFMGFSGEERGLLGSRHFVQNPTIQRERIVAMVNLDMIGRLRNDTIQVGGVGSATGFAALAKKQVEASGLKGTYDPSGFGPSDHASFYRAKIPVLFFFTGLHEDYHRPSDDVERLNSDGAAKVANIALRCVTEIANGKKPVYQAVSRRGAPLLGAPQRRQRRGNRARIGIMPSRDGGGDGVRIEQITPDGAAGKAGLKSGDVITQIGSASIKSLQDLIKVLGTHKPGDQVVVKATRAGKTLSFKVKLGS